MLPKRPRLDPALYVGLKRYFLTFCTAGRHPWFVKDDVVHMVLEQLLQSAARFDVEVVAYCFMPDHLHLLLEGTTVSADARAFVHQAKQRSGYAFCRTHPDRKLWQPSYYDRVLHDDDVTLSVAKYTLENPVRARLVESPLEYPFIGSIKYPVQEVLAAAGWQP